MVAWPVLFSNNRIDRSGIRFTYGPLRRQIDWNMVCAIQSMVGPNGRAVLLIRTDNDLPSPSRGSKLTRYISLQWTAMPVDELVERMRALAAPRRFEGP